jgi:hypothetical protein
MFPLAAALVAADDQQSDFGRRPGRRENLATLHVSRLLILGAPEPRLMPS